jgi:hypothetical protein
VTLPELPLASYVWTVLFAGVQAFFYS